jgi:rubrerythrin
LVDNQEDIMAFNLFDSKGTPIENQRYTWRDIVRKPLSKLDDDAFTRVRVIIMNGIEIEALRFQHMAARFNRDLRLPLAMVRRSEQHQATMINWLIGADHSPLETTIAYEQVAIELTAAVAQREPDPYLAQVYRFGLLEDFDHLYRYSALLDRLEGKDPNNIVQSYTDIVPGRPTWEHHRHPADDLRNPYDRNTAAMLSKLHALTITAAEQQTHNYYMNVGPLFSDPVARQLYAEIASVEEQHVTQYESLLDPSQTWLEQWVLHEANEAYNYYSMVESETNHQIKAIWERFLDYELGHFHVAAELFQNIEGRDAAELITGPFTDPIPLTPQRDFYRQVLIDEVDLRADGPNYVPKDQEPQRSRDYRAMLHSEGEPSGAISAGYVWAPGTELMHRGAASGATIPTGTMAAARIPASGITRH